MLDIETLQVGQEVWHQDYKALTLRSWSESRQTLFGTDVTGKERAFSPANACLPSEVKVTTKQKQTEAYESLQAQGYPQFDGNIEAYKGNEFDRSASRDAYDLLLRYALKAQAEGVKRIEVHAPPNHAQEAYAEVSADMGITLSDAEAFVHIGKEKQETKSGNTGHSVKYNLLLPNAPELAGLDHALKTNIGHRKQLASGAPDISCIQINKESLIRELIRDGVVPKNIEEASNDGE